MVMFVSVDKRADLEKNENSHGPKAEIAPAKHEEFQKKEEKVEVKAKSEHNSR